MPALMAPEHTKGGKKQELTHCPWRGKGGGGRLTILGGGAGGPWGEGRALPISRVLGGGSERRGPCFLTNLRAIRGKGERDKGGLARV